MANPNPHQARQAKRRQALAGGSVEDLRALLWTAIERAADLTANDDPATQLKAIHALSQASGNYARLVDATEFEARLRALEDARVAADLALQTGAE